MSNEVITHKHEWVRGLFSELDRIAKDAATMADENQPLLGGEHYLTDRELAQRLKISRRTLQDYRNNGILPYLAAIRPAFMAAISSRPERSRSCVPRIQYSKEVATSQAVSTLRIQMAPSLFLLIRS